MKSLTATINESLNEDFRGGLYHFEGDDWKIEWNVLEAITDSALFQTMAKKLKKAKIDVKPRVSPIWDDQTYYMVTNDSDKNMFFYDIFYVGGKTHYSISGSTANDQSRLGIWDRSNSQMRGYKITKEEAQEFYKMYWDLWEKEISRLAKSKTDAVKNYF